MRRRYGLPEGATAPATGRCPLCRRHALAVYKALDGAWAVCGCGFSERSGRRHDRPPPDDRGDAAAVWRAARLGLRKSANNEAVAALLESAGLGGVDVVRAHERGWFGLFVRRRLNPRVSRALRLLDRCGLPCLFAPGWELPGLPGPWLLRDPGGREAVGRRQSGLAGTPPQSLWGLGEASDDPVLWLPSVWAAVRAAARCDLAGVRVRPVAPVGVSTAGHYAWQACRGGVLVWDERPTPASLAAAVASGATLLWGGPGPDSAPVDTFAARVRRRGRPWHEALARFAASAPGAEVRSLVFGLADHGVLADEALEACRRLSPLAAWLRDWSAPPANHWSVGGKHGVVEDAAGWWCCRRSGRRYLITSSPVHITRVDPGRRRCYGRARRKGRWRPFRVAWYAFVRNPLLTFAELTGELPAPGYNRLLLETAVRFGRAEFVTKGVSDGEEENGDADGR